MVDHPAPAPASTPTEPDAMARATRRAFQSHAETQLGEKPERAIREIERVYRCDSDAVVACSGGKDSLVTLALAAESDTDHRALHWDWGSRLVPRRVECEVVDILRQHAPDDRLFVASRSRPTFVPLSEATSFRRGLDEHDGIMDTDGSLSRLAGALSRSDHIGRQITGLRAEESGKRARKLDESGLYGESLGQPAAFPLREWTSRDVWAYIVGRDLDYSGYYDRAAHAYGDGSPRHYERARFTTVHDPEFEELSADGLASWRDHDIKHEGEQRTQGTDNVYGQE